MYLAFLNVFFLSNVFLRPHISRFVSSIRAVHSLLGKHEGLQCISLRRCSTFDLSSENFRVWSHLLFFFLITWAFLFIFKLSLHGFCSSCRWRWVLQCLSRRRMIHVEIFRRTSENSEVLKVKSHNLSGLLCLADMIGKTEARCPMLLLPWSRDLKAL